MFLAKLEIVKGRLGYDVTKAKEEKATLAVFDSKGELLLKEGIELFEKRFNILTSFNHHGDTYFFITEKIV